MGYVAPTRIRTGVDDSDCVAVAFLFVPHAFPELYNESMNAVVPCQRSWMEGSCGASPSLDRRPSEDSSGLGRLMGSGCVSVGSVSTAESSLDE